MSLQNEIPALSIEVNSSFKLLPFFKTSQAKFVLFLLAVVFYSPSINNEYALDDGIVIHQNSAVIKGVAGIGELLTQDTYHSFYKRMNASDQLSGGRYRPLPAITYAIEQEIIGAYRTGYYMFVTDLNRNGVLDDNKVDFLNQTNKLESNYEYNTFLDENKDGKATPNECYNCWDTNANFKDDFTEDLNADGVFNEVDCQVRGAAVRHFTNIMLYALICMFLFQLLSVYLFPNNKDLAFIAVFLFTIHPVHSEVIANIRGRDDLLSLLFITISLIHSFKFVDSQRGINLIISVGAAFLALLAKEYGLVLFILLPLSLYYFRNGTGAAKNSLLAMTVSLLFAIVLFAIDLRGLYLFENQWLNFALVAGAMNVILLVLVIKSRKENVGQTLSAATGIAVVSYLFLRLSAVNTLVSMPDTEVLNNPFLFASGSEAFATKLTIQLKNLQLMLWPHTLISDYSYNAVPYATFSDIAVWVSILLHLALLGFGIFLTVRRHTLGFGIIMYFLFILPTSNIFFFTSLMYLESFLFHASLGLCIAAAWLITASLQQLENKINFKPRIVLLLVLLCLLVPTALKSWERCKDWKNDITLFFKDVKNAPNSVIVLGNAGARWIDLADTKEITGHRFPGEDSTRFNDYNGTLVITDEEMKEGNYPDKRSAALNKGVNYLLKAVELHPKYVNGFLNLGLAYFKLGEDDKAIFYWKYAESLYPNNPYLLNYYAVYSNILKDRGRKFYATGHNFQEALIEFKRWSIVIPDDAEAYLEISKCFDSLGDHVKASFYRKKYYLLQPSENKTVRNKNGVAC